MAAIGLTSDKNLSIMVLFYGQTEVLTWIKRIHTWRRGGEPMHLERIDLYNYFQYSPPRGASATLQVLSPTILPLGEEKRRRPAVLILPGGGYGHVSPREAEPVALHFAAKGYATFTLNYSCAPHPFPVALREAAMAMRYIRTNAEAFSIHPGMVAAVGFSAGGHLCGMLGTLFDAPEVADIAAGYLLRPDALGLCYPVAVSWGRTHEGSFQNLTMGDEALRSRLSLEKLVRSDMPPVFLWHTRQDASVPCRNSLILAAALEEADVSFALHIYHTGPHGLSVADETVYTASSIPAISRDVPCWMDSMMDYFRELGFRITNLE